MRFMLTLTEKDPFNVPFKVYESDRYYYECYISNAYGSSMPLGLVGLW